MAVIDPDSGRINERVWSLEGGATARSIGSFQGVNVVYSGRVQLLSDTDQPTLVTTELIAPPNVWIEGLNPWSALDSEGS